MGIRAELKAGKTRSGYITACKCGERGCDQAHVDRNKKIGNTFAECRKEGVDTERYQESKDARGNG